MTHAPNRTNLPPAKSAAEYEREIERLRIERDEAVAVLIRDGYTRAASGDLWVPPVNEVAKKP